jgi:hypothetical protein
MRLGKLVSVGEVVEREPATQPSAGQPVADGAAAAPPDSGQLPATASAGH